MQFVNYTMRTLIIFILLLLTLATSYGQEYSLQYIKTGTDASIRGLSVADETAVWVSGSKGWIGRSADGGQHWAFRQVPGYEQCDFRSLYAFDASNAIIANAGSPSYVLRTSDGGETWTKVYENDDSAAFIDGVSFWQHASRKHGIIYGDPIKSRMLLLYTKDGGRTWHERTKGGPVMAEGEVSFAASGTGIKCLRHSMAVIATGGKVSRLFISHSRGRRWRSIATPMLAGAASTGTYSFITGGNARQWLITGGDYKRDTVSTANFFYSYCQGKQWHAPVITTRGYRECLAAIINDSTTLFAAGPTGIDISTDNGVTWQALNDEKGFHVVKPSADQKALFIAGSNGKLAVITVK